MHTKQNSNDGLMPDSAVHIARLEAKLEKIKKSNQSSKVTGKDLISSINQFNKVYMEDYMKNGNQFEASEENSIVLEAVNKTYLERKLLPEQPVTTEETQLLIENDLLSRNIQKSEDDS